jgi:dsDNA-specific endonuclease/ATPase MutS2
MFGMAGTATATTCTGTSAARWKQPLLPPPFRRRQHQRQPVIVSFKNNNNNKPNDMDRVLKEAWQNANDNFERFLFEAKKTAQRIDRQYSVSQRLSSAASAASARAREIDRDFQIGIKYRNFTSGFALNWPKFC